MTVRKHYLYAGERRVHYRRAGSGPLLVILPAVPHSSAMTLRLIEALADRYTVIALDAPGYGESAALPADPPSVEDYANALAETLDALNLERIDLYAADTSAAVAAEFAVRHPGRVRRLVLERASLPTDEERAELLARYCPPIEPDHEGSHAVKAWGRLRDMYSFRPWYRRAISARIQRDLPTPLELHHEIVDFFRADAYQQGPHAAWRYDLPAALRRLETPVTLLDTSAGHERASSRLDAPPNVSFAELRDTDAADAHEQVASRIREALSGDPLPDAPPPPPVDLVPGKVHRDYVNSRAGQLLVRKVGSGRPDGRGRPLILSYGSLFSGVGSEDAALAWATDRPVIGFDIPGVGDSPPVPGTPTMAEIAEAVAEGLNSLGIDEVDLYGSHTSAMLAIELAILRPRQVKHLILDGVTMFTDDELDEKLPKYFQPLNITDDGAYLVWSWHFARDMYLWYPWYDHRADHFRPDTMIEDAAGQHDRFVDFLKGGLHFISPYNAAMRFPSRVRLPMITVPTLFSSAPNDTLRDTLGEAVSLVPHAAVRLNNGRATPETREETVSLFRQFFEDQPLTLGSPFTG